jgi:hypothetical protein
MPQYLLVMDAIGLCYSFLLLAKEWSDGRSRLSDVLIKLVPSHMNCDCVQFTRERSQMTPVIFQDYLGNH